MAYKSDIRDKLERKLLGELKHLLWSYNVAKVKRLPEELIIEKYLQFGNKSDWDNLRRAFGERKIKAVWKDQMLLSGRDPEKQEQIVAYFFNASNPEKYISALKEKKLNRLVSRGI